MPIYAKKVDRSQTAIVKAMRSLGAQVYVNNIGMDYPDLMVGWQSTWRLVEVKELDGSFSRGQLKFLAHADAHVDIITGEEDAIEALKTNRRITAIEQSEMINWLIRSQQDSVRVKKLLTLIGRNGTC